MYQKSEEHINNARQAAKKGRIKIEQLRKEKKEDYYKNPKRCLQCTTPINYRDKKIKKFCNKSCAAKFNNTKRIVSNVQRKKTSETLKRKYKNGELISCFSNPLTRPVRRNVVLGSKSVKYTNCEVCEKLFIQKSFGLKKTCSSDCRTKLIFKSRKYQNGKRKTILYNNKIQGEVLLESSWELEIAEYLDSLSVFWVRPEAISWVDKNNKKHLYYPDFYLKDYDVYLDPKNPYCLKKDEEKLKQIVKKIKLIYGDLKTIKEYIVKLK